jgi:O-methyltransferase
VSAMLDVRDMYLDLLRSSLTRYGEDELAPIRASNHPMARRVFGSLAKRNIKLVRAIPFDEKKRNLGLDWPA